jgi:hypothetical protein
VRVLLFVIVNPYDGPFLVNVLPIHYSPDRNFHTTFT